jgi:hypothetical protein
MRSTVRSVVPEDPKLYRALIPGSRLFDASEEWFTDCCFTGGQCPVKDGIT